MEQLTSPTTSYGAIKYFAENAGTGIHPCVVVEIVLKWWSVRTDREHVNMSFITPLITTIQNVSSQWYNSVYWDERYKSLIKTLDIPERTATRYMCYRIWGNSYNERILEDCISKGDGTPAQLEYFNSYCSDNMERYEQSVPAFRCNASVFPPYVFPPYVFPPYGDTKHHWYIRTCCCNTLGYVSLITNSKEEMFNDIDNAWNYILNFVPLPGYYLGITTHRNYHPSELPTFGITTH